MRSLKEEMRTKKNTVRLEDPKLQRLSQEKLFWFPRVDKIQSNCPEVMNDQKYSTTRLELTIMEENPLDLMDIRDNLNLTCLSRSKNIEELHVENIYSNIPFHQSCDTRSYFHLSFEPPQLCIDEEKVIFIMMTSQAAKLRS